MATYEEPSEEIAKLFEEVKDKTSIPHWVEFQLKVNNKLKSVDGYKVFKLNDLMGSVTDGLNFIVVINENILGNVPPDLQEVALKESIEGVVISDTDAVSMNKFDFTTHKSILKHYGHEKVIQLKESIQSLYDLEKQKEDEAKAQKKAKRAERAAKKLKQ